ncbi:hypothetical protein TRFO_34085 [Tritrichomonas foetus]|uniref:Uncharacterized protein n=1 Tax=Tritrichomonas foetus TaxID=1144522 RepID=A0A1J4JPP5_9EUKA|nr:hypothetical protein TRFO_34085 [Tritrichomonas foetus]|eukprot:OHS99501.1 hypothetical protein TRFO_34085 [Tritrichomonas foetus]
MNHNGTKNDFVLLINNIPIKCNKEIIIKQSQAIRNQFSRQDQFSAQIENGDKNIDLVTKIINNKTYEIDENNISFLKDFSLKLDLTLLKKRISSYDYQEECLSKQIDQHPNIQFLIELNQLFREITNETYEEILKTLFTKEKVSQYKQLGYEPLSNLIYYCVVNRLSRSFKRYSLEEQHSYALLIIQLLQVFFSKLSTFQTYFNSFILNKYKEIKMQKSSISNYRQETFYFIHLLLEHKILSLSSFQNSNSDSNSNSNLNSKSAVKYLSQLQNQNQLQKYFNLPIYFLHYFSNEQLDEYLKMQEELNPIFLTKLTEENENGNDNDNQNEINTSKTIKSRKTNRKEVNKLNQLKAIVLMILIILLMIKKTIKKIKI